MTFKSKKYVIEFDINHFIASKPMLATLTCECFSPWKNESVNYRNIMNTPLQLSSLVKISSYCNLSKYLPVIFTVKSLIDFQTLHSHKINTATASNMKTHSQTKIWVLNPNLASKISNGRILKNFQNEDVN